MAKNSQAGAERAHLLFGRRSRHRQEDRPAIRREMGMVLSADHRVLDGVTALTFLKRVVQALEQPAGLLAI
nr:2-oxo acid dehydrogenase subunit E2 [Bordetella genomosp. 7]